MIHKKQFIIAVILFTAMHAVAKDRKNTGDDKKKEKAGLFMRAESDTTRFFKGKLKIISSGEDKEKTPDKLELSTGRDSIRKPLETSWGSFDIGFNNYLDQTNYASLGAGTTMDQGFISRLSSTPGAADFELRSGKSVNINFGIVKQQLSLYKNYISIVYGLTYDINNWSYKQSLTWHQSSAKLMSGYDETYVTRDSVTFKKNKLVTNYLQVPLLLRLETSPRHAKKNVYLSAGAYGGYLVRSHTKQIVAGTTTKIKQHNDFNINKFQYGAQFELGYQGFSLYLKRSFSTLTDYGTVQYPYSFGFRLTGL